MKGMKVVVHVMPKQTVLDPQGAAVEHAMHSLGFARASGVRVGKRIVFDLEGGDEPATRAALDKLCHDLLSNPTIEDFSYEIVKDEAAATA